MTIKRDEWRSHVRRALLIRTRKSLHDGKPEAKRLPNRNENRVRVECCSVLILFIMNEAPRHLATLIVCSRSSVRNQTASHQFWWKRAHWHARVRCPLAGYLESIRLIYETRESERERARFRLSRDGHSPHFTNKLFAKYISSEVGSLSDSPTNRTNRATDGEGEKNSPQNNEIK